MDPSETRRLTPHARLSSSVGSQKLLSLIDRENPVENSAIRDRIVDSIKYQLGRDKKTIDKFGMFQATTAAVRASIIDNWHRTMAEMEHSKAKQVAYLSLEFLMGRALSNALLSLELEDNYRDVLMELGFKLEEIQAEESDAALGNGGLGRLAACFLDSLACMEMPAWGYGLRYDYGMFLQGLKDGFQTEAPDYWLKHGTPFPEVERLDVEYTIRFYGHTVKEPVTPGGAELRHRWEGGEVVKAIAYDSLCPGHHTRNVANLRLWAARPLAEFSFEAHSKGDFFEAVRARASSENITHVLYPNDAVEGGRVLRLKQEYFFVSASLQDILARSKEMDVAVADLGRHFAVQLNDTHPALGVPELMRLLLDGEGLRWKDAWAIVTSVFSYTNHTVLPEALEKWPLPLLESLLPRHVEIIFEINSRFLELVSRRWPGDVGKLQALSLIEESTPKQVRMANLAIVGSHHVNGVAALHTEIIKAEVFADFYQLWPEKFVNVTNGVTPRRWIAACNPWLRRFITKHLQRARLIRREHEWINNLSLIKNLCPLSSDIAACAEIMEMKLHCKRRLIAYVRAHCGVELRPEMMFDTMVKRIHEYKRQLLNLLGVVHAYLKLKQMTPEQRRGTVPRAAIFAGKAAPGYASAKKIIKLINSVAAVVNADADTRDLLKCVFIPNYCVSNAEIIIPATDVSEQISTAGHEASGTGNMKAVMNGGIIIGTLDGANIEIMEEVGEKQIFVFGATADDVANVREILRSGQHVMISDELREVVAAIRSGMFGDYELYRGLIDPIAAGNDYYLICYDFDSYIACRNFMCEQYRDKGRWASMMVKAIARMSKFSSDRTIGEYAEKIWGIRPLPVLQHRGGRTRVGQLK
eukprot:gnl/Chilomastix_cuspidata/585.p2 GENE.gnl/Chilomastix_cuspidata/585~~gnl/Chilomastix_cuspidata/585.p2  ORF type:complete len:868 (+),score=482.94 gnl/Chilomastix_cuspidata/585:42-2645(+)